MSGNNNGWANPAQQFDSVGIADYTVLCFIIWKNRHSAAPYIGIWLLGVSGTVSSGTY